MIHYILFIVSLIFISVFLAFLMAIIIKFAWPVASLIYTELWYLYKKVKHEL